MTYRETKGKWKKLGLVFSPRTVDPWMVSHASNPFVEHISDSIHRVYYGCRDVHNRGSIASFDFDINNPGRVFNISENPIVEPGTVGHFDDSGVSLGSVVKLSDGTKLLYYVGWNLAITVPWRNSIGLAIADPNTDCFRKYSPAPLLDRSKVDPFSLSYPWVIKLESHNWLMYYGSNLSWGKTEYDMKHVLKIAHSQNGIDWIRTGAIAIDLLADEIGISRPCVVRDSNKFKMWYSHRTTSRYKIGYAESTDGLHWERMDDKAGIDISTEGWDSESISYSCVFDFNRIRYMLYNGNGYGRTGIGLAVLDA